MKHGRGQVARLGPILTVILAFLMTTAAAAAPYAAMVMDARSGEVLHSRNADTRLHPASLTKMMTLYIAFEAVERGEISLDTRVRISKKAASEPPSRLGLKAGQKIALRYLIRAAAVKSANDAATAIAEAVEGSEAKFARRMNRTAKALGMTRTTFKNAHGLTESGHLSTARDMTIMGRRLFYDYPQYYNIFSRQATDAGGRMVANTNRKFLSAYKGADGIKTGYTRAAGFNLVASAERRGERIIATVFGGRSTASRNAQVAELLDIGFRRAPSKVAERVPAKPEYGPDSSSGTTSGGSVVLARSPRPVPRPAVTAQTPPKEVLIALQDGINETLATLEDAAESGGAPVVEAVVADAAVAEAMAAAPADQALANRAPKPRPHEVIVAAGAPAAATPAPEQPREVVTRLSTSGGRHWGISVGRFGSRHQAEKVLLKTALMEMTALDQALRKVVQRPSGYDANFVGMSEEQADLACRRLVARNLACEPLGPD